MTVDGIARALASSEDVAPDGNTVSLTLAAAVAVSDVVTVSYETPQVAQEGLVDLAENPVATFSLPVGVVAPPTLQSATLASDGTTLTLTYNEPLDETSVPAPGAFEVKVEGERVALATTDPVSVAGRTVVLKLARPVGVGERVAVSYAKERAAPAGAGGL